MNRAILVGNISNDLELHQTDSGIVCLRFTIACQRRIPNAQGVREADFINCVAFRKTAEFISRYFLKGTRIAVEGQIRTGSYIARDGAKRYTTEVVVDNADFCERVSRESAAGYSSVSAETASSSAPLPHDDEEGFTPVDDDEELPF